jgi:hypothetical protein
MSLTINQVVLLIIAIIVLVVIIFLFIHYGVGPFKGFVTQCDPIRIKYCCEEAPGGKAKAQECFEAFKCRGECP